MMYYNTLNYSWIVHAKLWMFMNWSVQIHQNFMMCSSSKFYEFFMNNQFMKYFNEHSWWPMAMNIHELFCSKQKVHELIGHSSTVHEQFMKSIQEHFMNTCSWTVGKIFDERSMNCSWIYMNVHECTIKVHDFMN
jgi:hypothetical protein